MGRPTVGTIVSGGGGAAAQTVIGPAAGTATDNAIARWDGTTGALLQNSAVTVSDVAANVVTVATTAGNALALVSTAPTATTGASQPGKALTATASNAVASTDTAGAAAGGDVTLTSGNAARNASGNANGGNIYLVTGTGIGTGTAGVVGMFGTTSSFPGFAQRTGSGQFQVTDAARSGRGTIWLTAIGVNGTMDNYTANDVFLTQTANSGSSARLSSGNALGWASAGDASQSPDTGLSRLAAGVLGFGTGGAASVAGYYQTAGGKRVTGNQTVTDSTVLVSSTDLTCTVAAGRHYTFRFRLYFTTVNTSGVKVAISGTATHTSITYDTFIFGVSTPALLTITRATAKDTAAGVTATGTAAFVEIMGSTTINAGGTFLVQFAQNAETGAGESAILLRGSSMEVLDMQ